MRLRLPSGKRILVTPVFFWESPKKALCVVRTAGAFHPAHVTTRMCLDLLEDQLQAHACKTLAKIGGLTREQREFLLSEDADGFAGSHKKLLQRLETKSPAEIAAYVDGMMSVAKAQKFNPATDMAAIPLNTEATEFNLWKLRRPESFSPRREPGPISLNYYASGRPAIRTFANAPVAIYPEDLVAGKVDVAIVGAPLDMGSYYRGQRFGPMAMRNEYGACGIDMHTMVNPSKELNIVDYGDIAIDNMSTERTVHHVRERIAEIAKTGALPFIVGGDHSLE